MKNTSLAILLLFAALSVYAQEGLDRRVEVTKAYTPEVEAARKLSPAPRMTDTVALRPEINYQVIAAAWKTAFGVKAIAPSRLDSNMSSVEPLVYVKAGVGLPMQSVADAYVHSKKEWGHWGALVNHYGQFAKIDDDRGVATPASWTTNTFGGYARVVTGLRTALDAGAAMQADYFTRYGKAVPAYDPAINVGLASYQTYLSPSASISFGTGFTDLSAFNFRMGASGYYFGNDVSDSETGFAIDGLIGMKNASLGVKLEGIYGGGNIDYYSNTLFTVAPRYCRQGERLKFDVGFDMVFDKLMDSDDFHLLPYVDISWDLANGHFIPFAKISGRVENNGYRSLVRRNPYVAAGSLGTQNTTVYDLHGGISGSFSSSASYKLFAGASLYRSNILLAYLYQSGNTASFIPYMQDVEQVTFGGELSALIAGRLETLVSGRLHAYPGNTPTQKAADMPTAEATLDVNYKSGRLTMGAGIDICAGRYFYGVASSTPGMEPFIDGKAPTTADVSLKAAYAVDNRISIFLEAGNLLNQKLYPYDHYRGLGINCIAGIKMVF